MPTPEVPPLATWDEIKTLDEDWSGILLGNGASIAVWDRFAYSSLFDEAVSARVTHPLTEGDQALFTAFETRNFEQVLDALMTSSLVTGALGMDAREYVARYNSIQRGLFEAVRAVHVPWMRLAGGSVLGAIRTGLKEYRAVFSTNYDLLVYWSIMAEPYSGTGFTDYFWNSDHRFDPLDVEVWDSSKTRLLYLHGGLHLVRLPDGGTGKRVSGDAGNLLDQFTTSATTAPVPLLVSEGRSSDKLRSIRTSDYLGFAYEEFASHEGGLVIFGHSLGDGDAHLVRAMQTWRRRPIAIALRPADADTLEERRAHFENALPHADLRFFDSTTHPLGSANLHTPLEQEGFLGSLRRRLPGSG